MKLNKKQIKQIEKFAFRYYKRLDSCHNLEHAFKSMKLAEYLAKKEKANVVMSKYGALLHQFHPERKEFVEKFLKKINIDKDIVRQLVHCIECTELKTIHKARTLEAKIVFDADKLQAIGPSGIIRNILYGIEYFKMDLKEAVEYGRESEMRCFKLLQTKAAKKLAKKPHRIAMKIFKSIKVSI